MNCPSLDPKTSNEPGVGPALSETRGNRSSKAGLIGFPSSGISII